VIHTGLPPEDVEEVRSRVLAYLAQTGATYERLAHRCHLSESQIKMFMAGQRGSEGIVAHLVAYLPLDLVYVRARIMPN
jgi:hypothetical protein